jgi:hypothetical protein
LLAGESERKNEWTERIAVGGKSFVENVKKRLGFMAKGRAITRVKNCYQLRDNTCGYGNPARDERHRDFLLHNKVYFHKKVWIHFLNITSWIL